MATALVAAWPASFVWQPRAEKPKEVGARSRRDASAKLEWRIVRYVSSEEQVEEVNEACKWRYDREVTSVRKGQVVEERFDVEKWTCTDKIGFPDNTLEGKAVIVSERGGKRTPNVKGPTPDGIGPIAEEWMREEIVPDVDPLMDAVLPAQPVSTGDEWQIDPVKLALALELHALSPIVPERSKIVGKLSNVRLEEDIHVGVVEIAGTIALQAFPKTALRWTQGGIFRAKLTMEGPLEPTTARPVKVAFEGELQGRAEGGLPSGERAEQSVTMRVTGAFEDQKLEPRPQPKPKKKKRRR